jgi:hypothetical protein
LPMRACKRSPPRGPRRERRPWQPDRRPRARPRRPPRRGSAVARSAERHASVMTESTFCRTFSSQDADDARDALLQAFSEGVPVLQPPERRGLMSHLIRAA